MADPVTTVVAADPNTVVATATSIFTPNAMVINIAGYSVNLTSVMIIAAMLGILALFIRIQVSKRLDFADMITFDGKKVSLTKVVQLLGAITATWVIIKMTAGTALTAEIFGIYLAYVGGIEGYAKFIAAKYNYSETSIAQSKTNDINAIINAPPDQMPPPAPPPGPDVPPPPPPVPTGSDNGPPPTPAPDVPQVDSPSITNALADRANALLDKGSAFAQTTADLTTKAQDVITDTKDNISTVTGTKAVRKTKGNS